MIDNKFIDYLADKTGISDKSLIEKDFILHTLLIYFAKNKYFSKNFVFKGGTCLIKCYLGYFRFSEDLDYTYINQDVFKNKSEKEIRRFLSSEIDKLLEIIVDISKASDLDFKAGKENKKYVEFGGSNRFLTLKIWYKSSITNNEQFIKIQINYVDLFKYKFKELIAKPVIENGCLFRGGKEKVVRARILEADLIECIILLSEKLFYNTGAPGAIIILNKNKQKNRKGKILFINASNESEQHPDVRKLNILAKHNIEKEWQELKHLEQEEYEVDKKIEGFLKEIR
jgi:hypothetical protein